MANRFIAFSVFVLMLLISVQGENNNGAPAKDMGQLLKALSHNKQLMDFLKTKNGTQWLKNTSGQIQSFTSVLNKLVSCGSSQGSSSPNPLCFTSALADLIPLLPPGLLNSTNPHAIMAMLRQFAPYLQSGLSNSSNPLDVLNYLESQMTNIPALKNILPSLDSALQAASPVCAMQLKAMFAAISQGQTWALKMIDAAGKPGAGTLDGYWSWMGSFDQCMNISARLPATGADIRGRYCTAHVTVPIPIPQAKALGIPYPTLSIGLCMPDACTGMDISKLLYPLAPIKTSPPYGTCKEPMPELSTRAIAMIIICSLFAFVIAAASLYDIAIEKINEYFKDKHEKMKKPNTIQMNGGVTNKGFENGDVNTIIEKLQEMEKGDTGANGNVFVVPNDTPNGSIQEPPAYEDKASEPWSIKPGVCGKLLLAFSLYTNIPKLLNTEQSSDSLRAVHGIRFLSMTWVILGHTYVFTMTDGDNGLYFFINMVHRFNFTALINAFVSVDTFFALSGLLVAYLSLKEMKKREGFQHFNWGLYYFHRFWRLTPPYMLFLGVYVSLAQYVYDGPNWPRTAGFEKDYCKDTWWTNLLYINNVAKVDTGMCMGWTWYLANDMQFFILTPLLLIPLYIHPMIGMAVCGAFIMIVSIATGVISHNHNYSTNMIIGGKGDDGKFFQNIYIKPYCRMGPYVVGIIAGYILYRTKGKIKMPKIVALAGWLVATGMAVGIVYGIFDPDKHNVPSNEVAALYNAVNRTLWGVSVCWVVVACATGYGGIINRMLSWSGLVPLSRLTYCAYLVHPFIISVFNSSLRVPLHFTDLNMIYLFLGHLTLSYMAAFCISLAFESPMMGLEKVLLGRFMRKK